MVFTLYNLIFLIIHVRGGVDAALCKSSVRMVKSLRL